MLKKYENLEKWLIEQIETKKFLPNEMLPTEKQMEKQFLLSKMTVRKVMSNLKLQGLIYSVPGKGFMVSPFSEIYLKEKHKDDSFKIMLFPTNVFIPDYLLYDVYHNIDLREYDAKNWAPFIELYFLNKKVIKYSINWLYMKKKSMDFDVYRDYQKVAKMFNDELTIESLKIVSLEEPIKNDEIVFEMNGKDQGKQLIEIPVSYEYSFSKSGCINKVKMIRFVPTNFEIII